MYQKDVAKQLGTDQWTLINWEKNRTEPLVSALPAIYTFLRTTRHRNRRRLRSASKPDGGRWAGQSRRLPKRWDVDPTAVGNWEHGGTILCREHRKHIAAFIGMDEEALDGEMRRAWNAAHGKPTATDPPA
jgi:hypothetical protein